jgi:hypothetical protein
MIMLFPYKFTQYEKVIQIAGSNSRFVSPRSPILFETNRIIRMTLEKENRDETITNIKENIRLKMLRDIHSYGLRYVRENI